MKPPKTNKNRSNQKALAQGQDSLTWTRRDLHSFPHVSTVGFYCINYGPGSTDQLYHKNEKRPTKCEPFFRHVSKSVVEYRTPTARYSISDVRNMSNLTVDNKTNPRLCARRGLTAFSCLPSALMPIGTDVPQTHLHDTIHSIMTQ